MTTDETSMDGKALREAVMELVFSTWVRKFLGIHPS
jgi:hypothetical protein